MRLSFIDSLYVIEGDSLMQATGTTSVWRALDCQGGVYMFGDYLPVWLMIIIEMAFAFVLAVTMGSPLAFRLPAASLTHAVITR